MSNGMHRKFIVDSSEYSSSPFKLKNIRSRLLISRNLSLMKIPLTGMQLLIVRGLRYWIITGAIFAGYRLKRLGQSAESVSGLETQEKNNRLA